MVLVVYHTTLEIVLVVYHTIERICMLPGELNFLQY